MGKSHLLRKPLSEQLYLSGVDPVWLLPSIDDVVGWRPWPVDEVQQVWMGTKRRKVPIFEGSGFLQYEIVARGSEPTNLPPPTGPAILITCRRETMERLRVDVTCYDDYAVEMFHQLVHHLREIHRDEEKPAVGSEQSVPDEQPWRKHNIHQRRWGRWERILHEYIPDGLTQEQMAEREDVDISRIKQDFKKLKEVALIHPKTPPKTPL